MKYTITLLFLILSGLIGVAKAQQSDQPNFLIIVADDMGFSDMGAFGGDIRTPNLDELAYEGVRFTNFYVAPTCSPTRSMLLTGIDNHLNGLGNMYEKTASNQLDKPGYEGHLKTDIPTLPEILRDNGYHTYMAGKWHLGKSKEHLPGARGFERSFSMLSGGGSYWDFKGPDTHIEKNHYSEDGEYLHKLPKNYYATTTYTDKIIEYIDSNKEDGKPFFAYLAHQAPHDPLSVPNSYLRKYKGAFDKGWDHLRDERMQRMVEMGILKERVELGERFWYIPNFDDLKPATQVVVARKMEVYAAVVEYMDKEIGRLISFLEDNGMKENTYILFFSDNGPETSDKANTYKKYPATENANWMASTYTHGFQNWGRKGSWTAYGPSWAQVSAAPFAGAKVTTYEGGIRSPLVVVTPENKLSGSINSEALIHVKDIAPTFLDLAGINVEQFNMQGISWVNMLSGREQSPRTEEDYIAIELMNNKAVRKGNWKIVQMAIPFGTGEWELYNIERDPGERVNLATERPDKLNELLIHWEEYRTQNNVIEANRTSFDGLEELLPPRPPVYDPEFGRGSETVPEIDNKK